MPAAINRLANAASTDEAEAAYWELDNVVVVQGSVYEAAVALLDPLLRMLLVGSALAQRWGLELILQVGGGWTDPSELAHTGRDLAAEARARLAPLIDVFLALVASPDRHVRESAFEVAVRLGSTSSRVEEALWWVAHNTADDDERAHYSALLTEG